MQYSEETKLNKERSRRGLMPLKPLTQRTISRYHKITRRPPLEAQRQHIVAS
jgi:hypothetical protein